jgi:hypothetical protein
MRQEKQKHENGAIGDDHQTLVGERRGTKSLPSKLSKPFKWNMDCDMA